MRRGASTDTAAVAERVDDPPSAGVSADAGIAALAKAMSSPTSIPAVRVPPLDELERATRSARSARDLGVRPPPVA